jgi:hypothetical protein
MEFQALAFHTTLPLRGRCPLTVAPGMPLGVADLLYRKTLAPKPR